MPLESGVTEEHGALGYSAGEVTFQKTGAVRNGLFEGGIICAEPCA